MTYLRIGRVMVEADHIQAQSTPGGRDRQRGESLKRCAGPCYSIAAVVYYVDSTLLAGVTI